MLLTAGGIGGIAFWTANYPLDLSAHSPFLAMPCSPSLLLSSELTLVGGLSCHSQNADANAEGARCRLFARDDGKEHLPLQGSASYPCCELMHHLLLMSGPLCFSWCACRSARVLSRLRPVCAARLPRELSRVSWLRTYLPSSPTQQGLTLAWCT